MGRWRWLVDQSKPDTSEGCWALLPVHYTLSRPPRPILPTSVWRGWFVLLGKCYGRGDADAGPRCWRQADGLVFHSLLLCNGSRAGDVPLFFSFATEHRGWDDNMHCHLKALYDPPGTYVHKSWDCFSTGSLPRFLATQLLPALCACDRAHRNWSPAPQSSSLCGCHASLLLLQREGRGNRLLTQAVPAKVLLQLPGA